MAPGSRYRMRAVHGQPSGQITKRYDSEDLLVTNNAESPIPDILHVALTSASTSDVSSGFDAGNFSTSTQNPIQKPENSFVDDLGKKVVIDMGNAADSIYQAPSIRPGTKRPTPNEYKMEEFSQKAIKEVQNEVGGDPKKGTALKQEEGVSSGLGGELLGENSACVAGGMRRASVEDLKLFKNLENLCRQKQSGTVTDLSADSLDTKKTGAVDCTTVPCPKTDIKTEMDDGVHLNNGTAAAAKSEKRDICVRTFAVQQRRDETEHHTAATRPETTDFVARQMVSSALGVKVAHKKDEKTLAVKKALKMTKKADRLSTWDDFLSKQDKNI